MGYSKSYQVSSLKSGIINYKDFVRQVVSVPRPLRPGVIRMWFDTNNNMFLITPSGQVIKVLTEPNP